MNSRRFIRSPRREQISEGGSYARDLPQGPIGPMKALLETAALSWIKPKVRSKVKLLVGIADTSY
jgi:hypothetical protein